MATIRRRGDSWQVQVRRHGYSPTTRTFRTKSDALTWARKTEIEIETGDIRQDRRCKSDLMLGELVERYLTEVTV